MMEPMQDSYTEEISLRELIEALLKRWKAIAWITAICIILAGIMSFFVMEPSYEATAMLRLNGVPIGMEGYVAQITNYDVLEGTICDLNLKEQDINTEKLKEMMTVQTIEDTSLIEVTVAFGDPDLAARIANELVINSKGILIPIYENMLALDDQAIKLIEKTLQASAKELSEASEFVILKKNLVEDPALSAYFSSNGSGNLSIELKSEEMNTRYLAIQSKIFNDNLSLIQRQEDVANIQKKIEAIRQETAGQLPVNTFSEVFLVSKALPPLKAASPRKVLNLAIGAVLGLMLGVFWAFFREYWENTKGSVN